MRLWQQELIPYLPNKQILGQHRECCALRGRGWGRRQSTVDYAFKYDMNCLAAYHRLVMYEMERRGYKPNPMWYCQNYRGPVLGYDFVSNGLWETYIQPDDQGNIFKEHDEVYLRECYENLKGKYEKGKIKEEAWQVLRSFYLSRDDKHEKYNLRTVDYGGNIQIGNGQGSVFPL